MNDADRINGPSFVAGSLPSGGGYAMAGRLVLSIIDERGNNVGGGIGAEILKEEGIEFKCGVHIGIDIKAKEQSN